MPFCVHLTFCGGGVGVNGVSGSLQQNARLCRHQGKQNLAQRRQRLSSCLGEPFFTRSGLRSGVWAACSRNTCWKQVMTTAAAKGQISFKLPPIGFLKAILPSVNIGSCVCVATITCTS